MSHLELTEPSIREALAQEGWPCDRIADDTYRSRFRTEGGRAFPLLLRVDPKGFLVLAIIPFHRSPESDRRKNRLYRRLLELNHSLHMAKLSIDDDLDIILSVEHPTATLDRSELHDALNVLSYYADRYHSELEELASD